MCFELRLFDFLALNFLIFFFKSFEIFLTLSVPGYGYYRNALCAVNSIAMFLLMKNISTQCHDYNIVNIVYILFVK